MCSFHSIIYVAFITIVPTGGFSTPPPFVKEIVTGEQQHHPPESATSFLVLDKYCRTMAKRHLKMQFLLNKAFLDSGSNENCWVELRRSGVVGSGIWRRSGEIKVLIHGFVPASEVKVEKEEDDLINDQGVFQLGEEYGKQREDVNVIVVDWTKLATVKTEKEAAAAIRKAGLAVTAFLMKFHQRNNLTYSDWKKVHLIGVAAGTHVAGVAGYQLQHLGPVMVGRITGVNPEGPVHQTESGKLVEDDAATFLDLSDADFVDIIHCHKSGQHRGKRPELEILGHANFYRCIEDNLACVELYTNSIQNQDYLACRCQDWKEFRKERCSPCKNNGKDGTFLGDRCKISASGNYYLNLDSPQDHPGILVDTVEMKVQTKKDYSS